MKTLFLLASVLLTLSARAQNSDSGMGNAVGSDAVEASNAFSEGREPAAANVAAPLSKAKPLSDDLRVQPSLPEAQTRRDTRSLQAEVFKTLFNKELKPDQREDALEE